MISPGFPKSERLFVLFIILINLILRFFRLNYPNSPYLDEKNFFIPAIRDMLNGIPDLTNEQPLLGKSIIVQSIKFFGDNPWGWRLPSAVFGTLLVLSTYILAKKVFGSRSIAALSSVLITFEISLFVHSRIVMMEVFYAAFVISAFIFVWSYIKNQKVLNIILAGLLFGLALQVKWAAAMPLSLAVIFVFFTAKKLSNKIRSVLILSLTVFIVYISLYLPLVASIGLPRWLNLQEQVKDYHTEFLPQNYRKYGPNYVPRFDKIEIYTHNRLSWLTNPQAIYFEQPYPGNKIAVILFQFNPLIFWGGLLSLIYLFAKKAKDLKILFIGSIFLSSYLPLFFTPNPVFPHYLLFGMPALAILLSFSLSKTPKIITLSALGLAIIVFALYYPLLTSIPVPLWYLDLLTRF